MTSKENKHYAGYALRRINIMLAMLYSVQMIMSLAVTLSHWTCLLYKASTKLQKEPTSLFEKSKGCSPWCCGLAC